MSGNRSSAARRGEKAGWIGGWIGGFLWVAILAIAFLVQGRVAAGASGLAIVAVAAATVARSAPRSRRFSKLRRPLPWCSSRASPINRTSTGNVRFF